MARHGEHDEPNWLEPLCRIASQYRAGDASIRELFQRAAPELDDRQFLERVVQRLGREPELVAAWQQYSYDKRGTPSPYLDEMEVGFIEVIDGQVRSSEVQRFKSALDACAAFILREALWVLQHRRHVG